MKSLGQFWTVINTHRNAVACPNREALRSMISMSVRLIDRVHFSCSSRTILNRY